MPDRTELTDLEKDALKETANVGAGNASTELGKIINKKIPLVICELDFIPIENMNEIIGGPKRIVVGIASSITGGMGGCVVVVLETEKALALSALMQNKKIEVMNTMTNKDRDMLKKVGMIMTNAYIDALGKFLDIKITSDDLRVISTFGESIVDILMMNIDENMKYALIVKTNFAIEGTEIKGSFVLVLAVAAIEDILKKIQSKI